jgi:hypothetical protein
MSMGFSISRRLALTLGCSAFALAAAANAARAGSLINGDSLLVTTTTYEDVGQVGALAVGDPIPGGPAISNGKLNTVWNNSSVDGQFGVTSPLIVQDLSAANAKLLASGTLPTNEIVTSFSSKSELGLSITQTSKGAVATFMGYAPGGAGFPPTAAGMLDVSNADNTAFKDTTNAASVFYTAKFSPKFTDWAFNRSVVALSVNGAFAITQTNAYGGDNSRAAVLAPNGLYYTVGNSNSGTKTPPQLAMNTGLEVVRRARRRRTRK